MPRISLLEIAHTRIKENLPKNGLAIDATVGNGHDTVFLAEQVGQQGIVYGFDIQQAALDATRMMLDKPQLVNTVQLFLCSHDVLADYIANYHKGKIHAVMFNLGYLPGSDKSITTQTETTQKAVKTTLSLLAPKGIMTILAYPGHPGGLQETEAITEWCNNLESKGYTTELIKSAVEKKTAPQLFILYNDPSTV